MHGCKYGFFEWMFYTAKTASNRAEVMSWVTFHLRASTYFRGNPVNQAAWLNGTEMDKIMERAKTLTGKNKTNS